MMGTLNEHLQQIHKELSIKDEDRMFYTNVFEKMRDWLMAEMKGMDQYFRSYFKGTELFGSYSNQVRIVKPSEFDVFMLLELPFPVDISSLEKYPGYVEIKSQGLQPWNYQVFVGDKLDPKKFHDWIENIITKIIPNEKKIFGFLVKYQHLDVSHNIRIEELNHPFRKISFDFVPAIIIDEKNIRRLKNRWKFPPQSQKYLNSFRAVPKSLPSREKSEFQLANTTAEKEILWDKQNLKVVFRLLKSLRDKYEMRRIKSYYFTTVFLHEVDKQRNEMWQRPISEVLLHMLSVVVNYFRQHYLPYYWNQNSNLLCSLESKHIDEYTKNFSEALNKLKKFSGQGPSVRYEDVAAYFKMTDD